jgi:hypothetical protein
MELVCDMLSGFFIEVDEFFDHISGFVGTVVLDDDDFEIKIT